MASQLDKYKKDLDELIKLGSNMVLDLTLREVERRGKLDKDKAELKRKIGGSFEENYQQWFTEARSVLKQLLPDRLVEFDSYYRTDPKRKEMNLLTYTIQDWLMGLRSGKEYTGTKYFDDFAVVSSRLSTQLAVLTSVQRRFESTLFEIRQLVQADLFDSELEGAREILSKGFLRAAGIMAGVVLEKHLAEVTHNHGVSVKKQHRGISDYNDLLKNEGVLDVPLWRMVQRLADLRNLCGHKKQREPTKAEIEELIDGVAKISKTVY